jgi:hypothetical protein
MIGLSAHSKLAMAAIETFLAVSACGVGSGATGMTRTDGAAPAASDWVSPAGGSSVQDMRDLYALKKQVAALRRGQRSPAFAATPSIIQTRPGAAVARRPARTGSIASACSSSAEASTGDPPRVREARNRNVAIASSVSA